MATAELYKREVVSKQGRDFLGSYFDAYDESNPMDQDDLGDSMFDSMITWREYDLVLAIKLETATYPEGTRAPKKEDKLRYQIHRNRIVKSWLAGVDFKNRLQPNLEDAVNHRVPAPLVERLRVIMEKKRYKLKINDLTESEKKKSCS
jgi:hypothetical protein